MSIWNKNDEIVMEMHGAKADGKLRTCQVCGKEPDAMWAGSDVMTVCRWCATSILPALMADALCRSETVVPKGAKTMDALKTHWGRAESFYWRAVANNLAFVGVPPRRLADDIIADDIANDTANGPPHDKDDETAEENAPMWP